MLLFIATAKNRCSIKHGKYLLEKKFFLGGGGVCIKSVNSVQFHYIYVNIW